MGGVVLLEFWCDLIFCCVGWRILFGWRFEVEVFSLWKVRILKELGINFGGLVGVWFFFGV